MRVRLATAVLAICVLARVHAQPATLPAAVDSIDLGTIAGEWYEVAAFGSWSHRRCVGDTHFEFMPKGDRPLAVRSRCRTATGADSFRGLIRAPQSAPQGRLSVRYAPAFFSWLPAVWSDHWILAVAPNRSWLLVGDRHRERLAVLSRWVALDEASLAVAISHARTQGFDVDRLVAGRAAPAKH